MAAVAPGWAATTAAHTRSIIDCHLHRWLGHRPVAALTTAEIDQLYARLLTGGGAAAWRPRRCAASTESCTALAQALQWGWIWSNPPSTASPPRVRRAELRPPTAEEVTTLLAWPR